MEKTDILFGNEARVLMLDGINKLADAVGKTVGPAGRNVIINEFMQEPHITKDGVTVAKSIKFNNPFMEAGAKLIRQAASKTCDDTGDGTTSVTILSRKMINDGMNLVCDGKVKRLNKFRDGMICAANKASEKIKSMSVPCDSKEMIKHVATISGNNDKFVGDIVCEAMMKATKNGAISIESSPTADTFVETIIGMRFDKGFKSPMFANSEDGQTCEYDSCNILLWDGKIDDINSFIRVLEPSLNQTRPLLIIADGYSNDILNALSMNKMRNGFNIVAVEAPSFRDQRKKMMEDIALMVDGYIVNKNGITPDTFSVDMLGSCEKITVTKDYTTIVGGDGDEDSINERVEDLKAQLEVENDKTERINLKERISKLAGGVSIIYCGGNSEAEVKELKDRMDDAVCAVRSAMEMGVVPGGGITYMRLTEYINELKKPYYDNSGNLDDFGKGIEVVEKCIPECYYKIMDNCYVEREQAEKIANDILANYSVNAGYNADEMVIEDNMIEKGIIDPTKTSIMVLLNATSVAAMFLTTDCAIVKSVE